MRMQEIGSQAVYDTLQTLTAVTDLVGTRIVNMSFWPQDVEFPACMHYAEPGGRGYARGAINVQGIPIELEMRYVIRFGTWGESTDAIDTAADAVVQRFSLGAPLIAPAGYTVESTLLEPWPQQFSLGALVEGGEIYRQVGDYYAINVLRTG
jgi:hypothetical protein